MKLRDKQRLFARLVPLLMQYAFTIGYELTFGNTTAPTGNPTSVHPKKIAIDFNLFIDGKYQRSSKAHEPLGQFWKSLHPLCRWGGDFPGDGNHYSLEHNGRK